MATINLFMRGIEILFKIPLATSNLSPSVLSYSDVVSSDASIRLAIST